MSKDVIFNGAAAPAAFPKAAIKVLSQWWADQLPGAKSSLPQREFENTAGPQETVAAMDKEEALRDMAVTPKTRALFAAMLEIGLTHLVPEGNFSPYLKVKYEFEPDDTLKEALRAANIEGAGAFMPSRTVTYIQEDGRVFVPDDKGEMVELSYEGSPAAPLMDYRDRDFDFSGCPLFVNETFYLVVDVPEGREVTTCFYLKDDGVQYQRETARAGQVLTIPQLGTEGYERITAKTALDADIHHPGVTWAHLQDRTDFIGRREGTFGGSVTKMDDEGHYRYLSLPFRAFRAAADFACKSGENYTRIFQGDVITDTYKDGCRHFEVVRRDWIGPTCARRWLPCTEEGTVTSQEPVLPQDIPLPPRDVVSERVRAQAPAMGVKKP